MDTYNRAGCPRGEKGGGMPNFNRVSLYAEQKEAQVLFELLVIFLGGGWREDGGLGGQRRRYDEAGDGGESEVPR